MTVEPGSGRGGNRFDGFDLLQDESRTDPHPQAHKGQQGSNDNGICQVGLHDRPDQVMECVNNPEGKRGGEAASQEVYPPLLE